MSSFYLFCAGWGGQDGSLLFWTFLMGVLSFVAAPRIKKQYPELFPGFLFVASGAQLFFGIITFFAAGPFNTLDVIPPDGKGLNPLLQTPVMAIHPPNLYMGLITFYIPFALGMAALISNKLGAEWLRAARPWTLIAWMFLTLGNLLGGYWAYNELGWGGFWAWDPVENAAFLPWLTATAFVHTSMIQERQGMMKVWNMSLLIVTYFLTVFGTFLTRSGLISSIHAFARSDIGNYFVVFLIVILGYSLTLMFWRYKGLRGKNTLASPYSKEASFLLNNALFSISTFIVLLGTTYPLLREWMAGNKATVGPAFFNRAMAPVALALLTLMGICPLLGWIKVDLKRLRVLLIVPIIAGIAGGIGFVAIFDRIGPGSPGTFSRITSGVIAGLCVFIITSLMAEITEEVNKRLARGEKGFIPTMFAHIRLMRRRYGGYLVHVGVVFVFIGFAGYSFKLEKATALAKGELSDIGGYVVRFLGLQAYKDKQKRMYEGHLALYTPSIKKRILLKEGAPLQLNNGQATLTLKRIAGVKDPYDAAVIEYKEKGKQRRTLSPKQSIPFAKDLLRMRNFRWGQGAKLEAQVQLVGTNKLVGKLVPSRHKYNKHREPTTEVALMTRILDDIYAILVTWENDKGKRLVHIKFYLNPLVFWLWFGGLLMLIGGFIAILPKAKPKRRTQTS